MLPNLDPKIKKVLDLTSSEEDFLTAPVRWIDDERGELIAVGVGSMDGHPRQETAALLHTQARMTLTRSATQQRVPQVGVGQTLATPQLKQSQPSTQTNSVTNLSRQSTRPDSLAPPSATESNPAPQAPLVMNDLASKPPQKVDDAPTSLDPRGIAPQPPQQAPAVADIPPVAPASTTLHAHADTPFSSQPMPLPANSAQSKTPVTVTNGTTLPDRTLMPDPSNGHAPNSNGVPQLPPSSNDMPAKTEPPPIIRTETVYMTPMGDAADAAKQLS